MRLKQGKEEIVFDTDEYPALAQPWKAMAKLKPAFDKEGTVTAAMPRGLTTERRRLS